MTDVPVATAEGSLARTPFGHVLIYIVQHNLTGTLVVWGEDGGPVEHEDRLFLREGHIVAARLHEPASTLERGVLPLFVRSSAPYAFYADVNLLGSGQEVRTGRAHPYALFAASLRGAVREDAIDSVLGKLAGSRLRLRPGVDLARYEFQPREQQFIEVLRAAPITPEEVATETGFAEKTARRLLYLLIATKAVEPYVAGASMRAPYTPSTAPFMSALPPGSPMTTSASSAGSHAAPGGASMRPHPTTGSGSMRASVVPSAAGAFGGQVANATMGSALAGSMPTGAVRPPSTATSMRPGTGGGPAVPAGSMPPFGPPSSAAVRGALRASKPPPPPPPPTLSPEQVAQWKEITDRATAMEEQNYFQMLGVPMGSAADACREAYFVLVKKFHPDRLSEPLKPIAEQAKTVFRYITEAHDTLTDESKREKYLEEVRGGGGTPAADRLVQNMLEASMEFQRADVLMRRKEYDGAIAHARIAATMHPQEADYHAFIAWCMHLKYPDANAPIDEMLACIDRALERDDKSDKIHHWRGVILRRAGRDAEAITHFEKAAALNPRNVEALREVRIAKMRGQSNMSVNQAQQMSNRPAKPNAPKQTNSPEDKKQESSGGGLFGGLFGKKKS